MSFNYDTKASTKLHDGDLIGKYMPICCQNLRIIRMFNSVLFSMKNIERVFFIIYNFFFPIWFELSGSALSNRKPPPTGVVHDLRAS